MLKLSQLTLKGTTVETYFDVTKYIKANFSHKVQPFQFQNYIIEMVNKMSVEKNIMIKDMPKGRYNKTMININIVPILAKWLSQPSRLKHIREGKDIENILFELLLDCNQLGEYIEPVSEDSVDKEIEE